MPAGFCDNPQKNNEADLMPAWTDVRPVLIGERPPNGHEDKGAWFAEARSTTRLLEALDLREGFDGLLTDRGICLNEIVECQNVLNTTHPDNFFNYEMIEVRLGIASIVPSLAGRLVFIVGERVMQAFNFCASAYPRIEMYSIRDVELTSRRTFDSEIIQCRAVAIPHPSPTVALKFDPMRGDIARTFFDLVQEAADRLPHNP